MKNTLIITSYTPGKDDSDRIGAALSRHTKAMNAPDYNPIDFAFRATSKDIVAGEMTAQLLWGRVEIKRLHVEPDFRGCGVGKKLLEEAEKFARAHSAAGIHLWTVSWQGEGFYERCGFQELGRIKLGTDGYFDDRPQYQIYYHKEL